MPTKEDYEYVKELKAQIENMNSCHQGTVAELVGMTYERDRLRAEIARMQIAFDQELSRREDRRASRD